MIEGKNFYFIESPMRFIIVSKDIDATKSRKEDRNLFSVNIVDKPLSPTNNSENKNILVYLSIEEIGQLFEIIQKSGRISTRSKKP